MKPPVPYFGSKARIAARITGLLPVHGHYVEPFAGSLAVLLAKPVSRLETVNDIDGDLMLFWRVLRDRGQELVRVCALTPHSRREYQSAVVNLRSARAHCVGGCDVCDLERARLVWLQLTQSRSGTRAGTGWRRYRDPAGTHLSMPGYLSAYAERIPPAAQRLATVRLESRPALDVIADYGADPGVLLYVDPPYPAGVRAGVNYLHEMGDAAEHEHLVEALNACRAQVVLSGYRCPLYERLLPDWASVDIRAHADGAARSRTETLWFNRAPAQSMLDFTPNPAQESTQC